jgi:hypothetical protein
VPLPSSAVYICISSAVSGGCPSARKRLREPNGRFVEVYASSRRRLVRFRRCVCASARSRVDCARRCRARSRVRCRSAMIPRALSARSSEVRDRSVATTSNGGTRPMPKSRPVRADGGVWSHEVRRRS